NMRVLMLGWEYPPHIAGGLGVACEGLTKALARQGVAIRFIVPQLFGEEHAPHMQIQDPPSLLRSRTNTKNFSKTSEVAKSWNETEVDTVRIPAALAPYWSESAYFEQCVQYI